MKVLKPGRKQQGWSVNVNCSGRGNGDGGCGALLQVEQPDLYRTVSGDYDGSRTLFMTFTCPECGVETDLETYPSWLLNELPSKEAWTKLQDQKARQGG